MKKLLIIAAVLVAGITGFTSAKAQVNISINIGSQPEWGPTGYDYVEYYYLPDEDIYYNVPNHRFYYQNDNKWIYSNTLPARYRNIDLYKAHKVVLKDKNAFNSHTQHVKEYAQFKGKNDQQTIRDDKDDKYSKSKNNWQNNKYKKVSKRQQAPQKTEGHDKGKGDQQHH